MLSFLISCLLLGAIAGFFAGLFGIGGGIIIVPTLTYLLPHIGVPSQAVIPTALGTSLATIIITGFSSAQRHHKLGNIVWPVLTTFIPSLMVSIFIAGLFVSHLPRNISSKIFACIMIYLSIKMFLSIKPKNIIQKKLTKLSSIVGGIIIGAISSASGIGGGSFIVAFLNSRGVEMKKAIGTSSVCAMFLGISGTISYALAGLSNSNMPDYSFGYIYLPAVIGITLTSFVTSKLGASTTNRLPVATLKKAFSVLLALIVLKMMFVS
ncbi:hypothetical protein CEP48_07755 [Mergibacter septicus]|uniref:Probable membrane transporter protein n=1 Tax=Mergibacter septicus TaxID=221402 RepID=A0A8D4J116_9PAST|nr:sulfite exporter TauE/SafE family protein [Mergibacter septicus]AWX16069.1 hypothetical protein CEP47_07755 [Mergibacter septicus]QDJ13523.1 hypothetical protein CEP45_06525 [Mergibacter septicus]QDJ15322.1 hypothetical protein CEP48_07755 [Mergibacter septicus]UTU48810.1 sulfite exporter TauE/SafE family protein [Mergibacter septicus]WMR95559.1 sulfite exporter TauE/SafE family protein [Mergibacter septicus]